MKEKVEKAEDVEKVKDVEEVEDIEEVETLYLSEFPEVFESVRKVRKGEQTIFPSIGKTYDGVEILRCPETIDPGVYLVVLIDKTMFYVINDTGTGLDN